MEKQLSLGLESFSTGILKNRASWKKHLSSKRHEKPRQPINKLLPKKEKKLKIKSLSLKGAGTEKNTLEKALPVVRSSKKELLFDNLITIKELADYIGVSPKTVQNWVAYRTIPFMRIGRRTLFRKSRMEAWLQTKEFEPCP